jgi:hypothetical protein
MYGERLLEEVGERQNMQAALKQVRANKGSAGVDDMSVDELPDFLKVHWPEIKAQLLDGPYQPQVIKRVEIPKPGSQEQPQAGDSVCHRPADPASHSPSASVALGPDVFRVQLWLSAGAKCPSSRGPGSSLH